MSKLVISLFNNCSSSPKFVAATDNCVSSANIPGVENSKQFGRSLMYKRKSSGPKIDPWGTPLLIILLSDIVLLTTQHCVLFWRYDFNIPITETEIERQRQRQTDRGRDRQRQTATDSDRQRQTETDRETDR